MSNVVVALFFAVGVAGWTYAKITRRTGGNAKADATVVAIIGLLAFFIAWSLLGMFVD